MITTSTTSKGSASISSDQWHVVHSRFLGTGEGGSFSRHVSSEHPDRRTCVAAARQLVAKLRLESANVPAAERDEVFVRRPGFKSLKVTKRRVTPSSPQ